MRDLKFVRTTALAAVGIAALLLSSLVGVQASTAAPGSAIVSSADCTANTLPANDDGSTSPVSLPFALNFYGQSYSSLWVNNNGNVTFNGALGTYTPFGLQSTAVPIIAPFFADVDTRGQGSAPVQYGYGTTTFQGRQAFCVNWVNVGYYAAHADKLNSFQLLLVDRSDQGAGSFDIVFNYGQIQWETGDASGGSGGLGGTPARVGFSSGTGAAGTSTEFNGSGISGALLDTSPNGLVNGDLGSSIPGRYVFGVRSQGVIADKYVALGDSYQSGQGAYNYDPATDIKGTNECHRSANAYPNNLVNTSFVKLTLDFRACSGAKISDMLVANAQGKPPWNDGIAQVNALGIDTRLVTVGIVGNDLGFSDTVNACVKKTVFVSVPFYGAGWTTCQDSLGSGVSQSLKSLQSGQIHSDLLALYRLIRAKAPYAQVIVVSYPHFFPKNGYAVDLSGCGGVFRSSDQVWMNSMIDLADTAIGRAAKEAGFGYVNMSDSNAGHEQCTSQPAMNSLVGTSLTDIWPESYHPNAYGHQLMTSKIETFMGYTVDPTYNILPQQTVRKTITVKGKRFVVNVSWPGSDVVTTLISPSGIRYTRAAPGLAVHDYGQTWEYYDITNPELGDWTVESYGLDVAAGGEPVTLSTFDEPDYNLLPIPSITTQGTAPTVTFDASGSSDPDGSVSSYFWDFGDGTTGTGAIVQHTYTLPGTFRASLAITDNNGEQSFADAPTTVVVPGGNETAINSAASVSLTNQLHVNNGNVVTGGDFECNSDVQVAGSVFASGNVYLTNNCRIAGDVYAGGTLVMDSTPQVLGSVSAVGNVQFQSTARIGGSVSTSGTFTVIDGLSQQALATNGSIIGAISAGVTVPRPSVAPYQVFTVGTLPASAITWTQWMNQTAAANGAPSWSQGLTTSPGCTMAPWSSSVNGSTASTSSDLVVDARSSASSCAGVALQQMTLSLGGDLTLIVDKFDAINGLNVVSRDGATHTLTVKVEGASGSTNNDLSFSAGTTIDPKIKVFLQTPGKVTVNGTSSLGASIQAGSFATSGAVNFG